MLENSCSSDVSIQQQLEFATAKPSTFHEVNILKCRYTTKKWYLDDQFFFFPLVEDRFVGELVSGESWGATLTHQHESWKIVSDFKPPEKFYSTHLPANQIDTHTLKQTHVQFPKNDRKKEKVVFFFLRLSAFGPGHWVNLNAVFWISTSFFVPNSCGVLVLHGQQQYMTLTPPQNEQNEPEEGPSKKENLLQNTNLYFSGPMLNFGGVTKRGMVHDCGW